jgi:hypothetical protein
MSDLAKSELEVRALRSPAHWAALVAWLLGVFATVVYFSTRHNDYPVYFHPNSGPQAREVTQGIHNYRQPLLLVTATRAARVLTGTPPTSQAVGELGNWVAATFGGLAAVCLTLLAFVQRGWLAAICAGAMLSICGPLVYYGHFFKEDTALVFGFALAFLALAIFLKRPTRLTIAMAGAACGVAVASKYIGALAMLAALPVIMFATIRIDEATLSRPRRLVWFLLPCLAAFAVANYPAMFDLKHFVLGVWYEVAHVSAGTSSDGYVEQEGVRTWSKYRSWLRMELPWTVAALSGVAAAMCAARWRAWPTVDRIILAFAIGFVILVTQSKVQTARHFLPANVLMHYLAAMGIVSLVSWRRLGSLAPWSLACVLLVPALWVQWRHMTARLAEFPLDTRLQLAEWIDQHLPPHAKIASCSVCALPEPGRRYHEDERRRLRQQVVAAKFAPDLGTLDELAAQGFTHVAVSGKRIGQVTNRDRVPLEQERSRHEHRQSFYGELSQRGRLLWESHRDRPAAPRGTFSGEVLMLYDISGMGGAAPREAAP